MQDFSTDQRGRARQGTWSGCGGPRCFVPCEYRAWTGSVMESVFRAMEGGLHRCHGSIGCIGFR